jgi:hypothetical protein
MEPLLRVARLIRNPSQIIRLVKVKTNNNLRNKLDLIKGSQTSKESDQDYQTHQLQVEQTSCKQELWEVRWECLRQQVLLPDKTLHNYSKSMHSLDNKLAQLNSHKIPLPCTPVILEVSPQFQV